MEKVLKTTTLYDEDGSPQYSILLGHHSSQVFNEAFTAEGWDSELWPEDYISHEYWIRDEKGMWSPSTRDNIKASPVTIADWAGPTIPMLNSFGETLH